MAGTRLTGWRKIANAVWDGPNDPQIYGALEIDATAIVAFLEKERANGNRVTPTHVVGRAIAQLGKALKAFRAYLADPASFEPSEKA